MNEPPYPRLVPLGDAAVLVKLGEAIDDAINARVHRLARALDELSDGDPRFGRPVPAYASVLVSVDPVDPGVDTAVEIIGDIVRAVDDGPAVDTAAESLVEIPTRYGGADGPDLDEIAVLHGLSPSDVVEAHASTVYRVHFLGFAPGFAYLARVPGEIVTPRLATPRRRVPAGSVGIAEEQTAVYPFETPGGWRLIGRTDVRVWRLDEDPPALLVPGRRVRFVPVRD